MNNFGNMNPQQILNMIMANNPQAQSLMNQIRNSGMSPKQYVEQYFKQSNVDINQFANSLGIKKH